MVTKGRGIGIMKSSGLRLLLASARGRRSGQVFQGMKKIKIEKSPRRRHFLAGTTQVGGNSVTLNP